MLIALLATTYLTLALTVVLAVEGIAGLMFRIPGKPASRRIPRFDVYRVLGRVLRPLGLS